jgi:hypothetical protein
MIRYLAKLKMYQPATVVDTSSTKTAVPKTIDQVTLLVILHLFT